MSDSDNTEENLLGVNSVEGGGDPEKEKVSAVIDSKSIPEVKPEAKSKVKKTAQFPWWLVKSMILLVVIVGLIGGGYYAWPHLKEYPQRFLTLEQNSENIQDQLSGLDRQLQQTRQQLQAQSNEYQKNLNVAQQSNQQLQSQLQEQQQQLRNITTTTSDDWKLAEAYYLSRMATQRLVMERNPGSALALLQAADDIIKNRADPQLHNVREQLAEDIVALKLFSDVDREGVYLQLKALSQQLGKLPQFQSKNYVELSGNKESSVMTSSDGEQGGFLSRVRNSFFSAIENMGDFVRVTHVDESLPTAPTLQQQQMLQYNLQSLLQTAQLSLLRDQYEIFQDSLQQAQQLLDVNYSNSEVTGNVIKELVQLQSLNFNKNLPDISQSELKLGEHLDRLHRIDSNSNGGATSHSRTNSEDSNQPAIEENPEPMESQL